jgi:hypothetical protein
MPQRITIKKIIEKLAFITLLHIKIVIYYYF